MIEIIGEAKTTGLANNSAKALKIESIVKAWKKINDDPNMSEAQKCLVAQTAMATIWRIYEGSGE